MLYVFFLCDPTKIIDTVIVSPRINMVYNW